MNSTQHFAASRLTYCNSIYECMYNFIFYTLYKYNFKDGPGLARMNGCMIVALALFIHIGFLLAVIKKVAPDFYATSFANSLPKDKIFGLFVIVVIGIGVYFWYNQSRIKKLLAKRKAIPEYVTNGLDILYVVLFLVIPLIPIIIIFWKR